MGYDQCSACTASVSHSLCTAASPAGDGNWAYWTVERDWLGTHTLIQIGAGKTPLTDSSHTNLPIQPRSPIQDKRTGKCA